MTRKRPFGITILAILAAIAAVVAAYHTLQYLHILPITLGPVRFFTFDLLGAILFGVSTVIWIWVASSLWALRPAGRMFIILLSALNLILAAFAIIGQSTFQAMLPEIIINGIILIYALT